MLNLFFFRLVTFTPLLISLCLLFLCYFSAEKKGEENEEEDSNRRAPTGMSTP